MYHLNVEDVTCGHCAATVEKAVKAADPKAKVAVNLEAKSASIESRLDPMYSSLRLKTLVTGRPSKSPAAATSIDIPGNRNNHTRRAGGARDWQTIETKRAVPAEPKQVGNGFLNPQISGRIPAARCTA